MTTVNQPTETVVVEDSVTHQAGDGMTANRPSAVETPDILITKPKR